MLRYGTVERLEEKLGWLRQFREPLKGWSEMEQTIDVIVDFVAHCRACTGGQRRTYESGWESCLWGRTRRNWART